MGKTFVVCGKGGVGKTAVVAMMAKILFDQGDLKTLLIDADPSGGLSMALSLQATATMNDVRKRIISEAKSRSVDEVDLTITADYQLFESLMEHGNLAFLSIGRPEEEGCYCQVNTLLRKAIELLSDEFELTLIDGEAGIEQINRRVIRRPDHLILLSDVSAKGLKVAETIKRVADESIQYGKASLLMNRVRDQVEAAGLLEASSMVPLSWIPEDATVYEYDLGGKSFFALPDCPALSAVRRACSEMGITE